MASYTDCQSYKQMLIILAAAPNVTQSSYFLCDTVVTATNPKDLNGITAIFSSKVWSLPPLPL